MNIYVDVAIGLGFLVDHLLIMGTNRFCGYSYYPGRAAAAAVVGGIHSGMCFVQGFSFLRNGLWRLVFLGLMCAIAFGVSKNALRRGAVFVLLSMALGGIATGIGNGGGVSLIISALVLFLICAFGFRDPPGSATYVPVELCYGEKRLHITALRDTGNTLTDPITGRPVLVVDADSAKYLTGLSQRQLGNPLESLKQATLSGLRLVPYRCVGKEAGFLLALHMQNVTIGNWKGSSLVAFAPEGLSGEGAYQALAGGVL